MTLIHRLNGPSSKNSYKAVIGINVPTTDSARNNNQQSSRANTFFVHLFHLHYVEKQKEKKNKTKPKRKQKKKREENEI